MHKAQDTRKHIVYMLVVNGLRYIGVTAKTEATVLRSVMSRVNTHWYRAQTEHKDWTLCQVLRTLNSREEIEVKVLDILEGKTAGHHREVELRRELRPELNTDCR